MHPTLMKSTHGLKYNKNKKGFVIFPPVTDLSKKYEYASKVKNRETILSKLCMSFTNKETAV
jgi:hypothetical protein